MVRAYTEGLTATYGQTAHMFGVGEATVSRLLRRYRETGDVQAKPVGGTHPRRVDLSWLQQQAELHPSARLKDRVQAWSQKSGIHGM